MRCVPHAQSILDPLFAVPGNFSALDIFDDNAYAFSRSPTGSPQGGHLTTAT